jgi:hypothetical protein
MAGELGPVARIVAWEVWMESIAIDLAPEQIVRWLLDEDRRDVLDLLINATRSYRTGELSNEERASLDDGEEEGLSETREVGILEVRPRHDPHRWVLRIRVEDDIGPRIPEDESVSEGEEEIDLSAFYEEFIKGNRGTAEATAEVDSAADKASIDRLLGAMIRDIHGHAKGEGRQ